MGNMRTSVGAVVFGLLLIGLAGCIKIETGRTREEAVASSESRASGIRAEWAHRFRTASPPEMLTMVTDHIKSVTGGYLDYGYNVATEWRKGSAGRGQEVAAGEMQEVVSGWVETERPILSAWEDNLEYGFERIKETGHFDDDVMKLVEQAIDRYYAVYSAVFYPSGDVDEYESGLHELKRRTVFVLEELERAAEGY